MVVLEDSVRMTDRYQEFLATKGFRHRAVGVRADVSQYHPDTMPFQSAVIGWALGKGRAALFAATGLGKTLMALQWAQQAGRRTLIVAPLAVARQTARSEGPKWGIPVQYARDGSERSPEGITITNYERIDAFDADLFEAVVLDESSILKDQTSKTRTKLIAQFANVPMRLCCTATPAPNDIAEIANHAEFLGVMTRVEMLATFFVHDDEGWRLRKHAQQDFYRWLASWSMTFTKPSDLGFDDGGYELPPLTITPIVIPSDHCLPGQLFATGLKGVGDRSRVRRGTLSERIERVSEVVRAEPERAWIAWCGLNDESSAMATAFPDATEVTGSQSADAKADALTAFASGAGSMLITKPSIGGFGLNLQRSSRQVFVGMNDSWESWFQAIRRSWRFGQTEPVHIYVVLSDQEEPIWHNVQRKEQEARRMTEGLVKHVRMFEQDEITHTNQGQEYAEAEKIGPGWRLLLGDSAERMSAIDTESVGFSVYSPPFASLYVYSPTTRDLGNSRNRDEFMAHYGFIIREVLRVTQPGRLTAVHVQQLTTTLGSHGVIGMTDFRGDVIREYIANGWIYHGEVCIDKDPQAQAIRTHSKSLLFVQLRKDSSWMRPALADYILLFRKPGENAVPVSPDISNDEWIEWARPIWYGIRESDTLNVAEGRDSDDERHICALQLGTIERCLRLWSNRGDLVLSPFAGIGSEGHEAIRLGRKFVGIELKQRYLDTAVKNLRRAEALAGSGDLFALSGVAV